MPYKVEFKNEEGYLHAIATGDCRTLDDLYEYGSTIVEATQNHGQKRVLMDFRGVYMELESFHATTYTEHLLDMGMPELGLKLAALVDEKDLEITRNFETAFRIRSIMQRAFLDHDEAVKWLLAAEA